MARIAQDGLSADFEPPLSELRERLKTFGTSISAKYLGAALRKASEPALRSLKAEVAKRRRVTGNLARAISVKVKRYTQSGNAVALIGFAATPYKQIPDKGGGNGKDQAFHAGLIEFGTKNRKTKGPFASSFLSKSPGRSAFQIKQVKKPSRGRSRALFIRPTLKPAYPKAFFKRTANGGTVDLGSTPAYAPIRNAWNASKSQVASELRKNMEAAIVNAAKDLYAP
jgi:hypothetical protein